MNDLLETFITVYETRSFTKAGEIMYISQPTVTIRIKKLEEEFGVSLFTRGYKQEIISTEAADLLYHSAVKYLNEWDTLKSELQQTAASKKSFKIATSHSAGVLTISRILKMLESFQDKINIEITMHDSESVFDLVDKHLVHFGIIEKPMTGNNTESFFVSQDEMVLAGEVEGNPFYVRESGSGVAYYTHKYLKENSLNFGQLVYIDNNELIIRQIEEGLGASIISKHLVPVGVSYQNLGEKYTRDFIGLYYNNEKDSLIKEIINKIKENTPLIL